LLAVGAALKSTNHQYVLGMTESKTHQGFQSKMEMILNEIFALVVVGASLFSFNPNLLKQEISLKLTI